MGKESQHKVVAVLDFLQELITLDKESIKDITQHHWHCFIDTMPCALDSIKINYIVNNAIDDSDSEERVLIEVEKPKFSPCPKYPAALNGWISTRDWDNFKVKDIQFVREKSTNENKSQNSNEYIEKFLESKERVLSSQNWIKARNVWRDEELFKQKVQDVFDKFYSIYEDLKTDSEKIDLMIGNGIFGVALNSNTHPLLLKRVKMIYDKKTKMKIIDTDSSTELYNDVLNELPYIREEGIRELQKEIADISAHPMNRNLGTETLSHIASMISTKCRLIQHNESLLPSDFYVIYDRPVIFIRDKQSELKNVINGIKEQVLKTDDAPIPLLEIVGASEHASNMSDIKKDLSDTLADMRGESEDILLAKAANAEQLDIARKIEQSVAVVVQGPPGTGKTHTIANLLGHFLAQGKHVLITSYTPKALSVLKDKLPKGIQNLCVALLDDSRKDMEKSIEGISRMYSTYAADDMKNQAEPLRKERSSVLRSLNEKRNLLTKAQRMEMDRDYFVFSGHSYSLSQMAKFMHDHMALGQLIPGRVLSNHILPLSIEDMSFLYSTNGLLREQDLRDMDENLPNIDDIIDPNEFSNTVKLIRSIENKIYDLCVKLDVECSCNAIRKRSNDIVVNFNEDSFKKIQTYYDALNLDAINTDCIKRAICAGFQEGGHKNIWEKLNSDIEELNSLHQKNLEMMFGNTVTCPSAYLNDASILATLDDIGIALSNDGKLSFFSRLRHSNWKKIISEIRINDIPIKSMNDCKIIKNHICLQRQLAIVEKEWNQLLVPYGEDKFEDLSQNTEDILSISVARWHKLISFLNWYEEKYCKFMSLIEECGFKPSKVIDANGYETDIKKLDGILHWLQVDFPAYGELCQLYFIDRQYNTKKIKSLQNKLCDSKSPISMQLVQAIKDLNEKLYEELYKKIIRYGKSVPLLKKRQELLSDLAKVAPEWAKQISFREGIHGLETIPKEIEAAWLYKQFEMQLEEAHQLDVGAIEREISSITEHLHVLTTNLAEKLAWYHLLENVREGNLKNNLVAWGKTMAKYGKGTGKNASMWMNKAKELMLEVQKAVPAWIMPLNKVWANVRPDTEKFDIIIIDEASQVDISAIPLLYFGKKIIIVGDDKQVSPSGIGVKSDTLNNLQARTIKGEVLNSHLYTADTSLYDIAQMNFETKMLKEHFRCVPEIIGYCNNLSYDNQIQPLREAGNSVFQPIITYRVNGHRTGKKENIEEAEQIAAFISACVEQPEYKDKTFGAITLLGTEQALMIRRQVREHIDTAVLEEHDFLCGNSAQFQGDERDIMFLSLVEDNPGDGLLRTVTFGKGDETKKRYNVAVSRAKDQLWIIHSMGIDDLKEDDIRRGLLEYAKDPSAYLKSMSTIEKMSDSIFECEVAKALVARGYHIVQQWGVGSYLIDMVAVYKQRKIAIECDGERWHSSDEQIANDMKRQAVLERLGWTFVRIRGSEYFLDPSGTIEHLIRTLTSYEIFPEAICYDKTQSVEKNELLNRVERRAQELILSWKESRTQNLF